MNLIQDTAAVRCNACADRHWIPYGEAIPDGLATPPITEKPTSGTRITSDGFETRYVCPLAALFGV